MPRKKGFLHSEQTKKKISAALIGIKRTEQQIQNLKNALKNKKKTIRKIKPPIHRFSINFVIDKETKCWNWIKSTDGYGYGNFYYNRKQSKAHRFSYEFFINKIPPNMLVCHHCDNPSCVNPEHLFLGTHKDNLQDMVKKGRSLTGDRNPSRKYPEKLVRGEIHHQAKLTNNDILEIRNMYKTGNYSHREISKIFNISKTNTGDIIRKKIWVHI